MAPRGPLISHSGGSRMENKSISKMWAGKHWLELTRLYVTVVHYKVLSTLNTEYIFPYILIDACFRSTPFFGQERNPVSL